MSFQEDESELQYLLDYLRHRNLNQEDAVARSDTVFEQLPDQIKNSPWDIHERLDFLARANFLFSFEINGDGILRYIVAEPPVLRRLGILYREQLERNYEREFYRRYAAEAILKELTPKLTTLRNPELRESLGICVLLLQYENSLATNFQEYSDTRKESQLRRILETEGPSTRETQTSVSPAASAVKPAIKPAIKPGTSEVSETFIPDPKMPAYEKRSLPEVPVPPDRSSGPSAAAPAAPDRTPAAANRRAVESEEYQEIRNLQEDGRWTRAASTYGVQFLLRIHFRKCEFTMVSSLVRTENISERKDLEYIRDTVTMMLKNLHRDPCLAAHVEEMNALRDQVDLRLSELSP